MQNTCEIDFAAERNGAIVVAVAALKELRDEIRPSDVQCVALRVVLAVALVAADCSSCGGFWVRMRVIVLMASYALVLGDNGQMVVAHAMAVR